MKYEYKVLTNPDEEQLNALGGQGFRVVGMFEREIRSFATPVGINPPMTLGTSVSIVMEREIWDEFEGEVKILSKP